MSHQSVLLREVISNLQPKNGEIYLDGTFGAGGYSRAILESATCKLYAIDRDQTAQKFAAELNKKFPDRFVFLAGKFSDSERLLRDKNITELDGMVFDIGVSSMQLDDKSRGFSFDSDARLDMRMDQNSFPSAYEIVNEASEKELARIIKEFGEEPKAKQIAKHIVMARAIQPVSSCRDLAEIARSLYLGYSKTDPATRTFQAIRIAVNHELDELKSALNSSITLLKKGGRLVVVSFHSLEDSIVKNFLKEQSGAKQTFSRYQPVLEQQNSHKNFQIISKSAISPSEEEVAANPRARSAKMRVAVRL
ncbi:MAG: 16S rRNA (cytosine(1402)-N(4))-methyltransferase RsmH [Alphaproteobacteria bacterium]|nr:16S rRNA (cytosine(1402)-N(4))-methyltransferase RsmH [Alphaproteobacteria bacterium]